MASPLSIIVFGASGDLTGRKLTPALFQLHTKKRLPADTRIVGVARSAFTDEQFRAELLDRAREVEPKLDAAAWQEFLRGVEYVRADAGSADGLKPLVKWLADRERGKPADRLYYLSVGPDLYPVIAGNLAAAGLSTEDGGFRRLVVEKPFGRDLTSAEALNRVLLDHFKESQIYRIDHYLGKETVQNILVFRFANTLFEALWNYQYIDHVQITVAESVGVGKRAAYYDESGVLRDMFQNHLLQTLALVAMERPRGIGADALRDAKLNVLKAVRTTPADLVAGQYAGYRSEPKVPPDTRTPTFAGLRLFVQNDRWRDTPFYLRSGKSLATRCSEVVIQFLCPPGLSVALKPGETVECNRLTLRIQPDEGIRLNFQLKSPDTGEKVRLHPAALEFDYEAEFGAGAVPEAYELLLLEAIRGDPSLFMRGDEIEQAWRIVDPLIAATEWPDGPKPEEYAKGSWGPACSAGLIHGDGREWQDG
jgi:glucose-6-phosphate 1-dehydrogenase